MEEGLKSRASKKSTIAALSKKANREDLDAIREELGLIKQSRVIGYFI
jgi:hypothetical protein